MAGAAGGTDGRGTVFLEAMRVRNSMKLVVWVLHYCDRLENVGILLRSSTRFLMVLERFFN